MKKKLFTWYDSLPWIPCLALVGLVVYALVNNFLKDDLLLVEGVIFGLVAAIFLALVIGHYIVRYNAVKKWNDAPKLWDKVAIFNTSNSSITYLLDLIKKDVPLRYLRDKWTSWGVSGLNLSTYNSLMKVENSVAGCTLHIIEEPFKVGFFDRLLAGLQDGENITVLGPNKADPNMVNGEGRFLLLIGHETSHRICGAGFKIAYGEGGDNHHKLFAQTKICS